MSLIEDAHALIASGWPVFPCSSRKLPAISQEDGGHGFHDATLDTAAADRLFACQGAKLIGVPTGEASGFDVLDLDYKNGALEWEKANQHRLPETRIHRTMSGGRHYLFRHAPGVRNSASRISPGVDVRGEGGYIIAPPSPAYSVESDAEIAEWPDWLLEQILTRPPAQDQRPIPRPVLELSSKRLEGLTRSILSRVTAAVPGGKHFALRNAALSLGGIMDIAGIGESDAVERLLAALPEGVVDWNAARATAVWGLQRGRERPLELPDRRPNGNGHGLQFSPLETAGNRRKLGIAHPEPPDHDPTTEPGYWDSLQADAAGQQAPDRTVPSSFPNDLTTLPLIYFNEIEANLNAADFVEDLLIEGGMSVVYGESNSGKTFFVSNLALHVASGTPWCGREVENSGVIYCALEGSHGISNRIAAYREHYKLPSDTFLPFAVVPTTVNLLDPSAHTEELIGLIRSAAVHMSVPVRLVVIDTLARALAGGNENASEDMGALVINTDRIRLATKAHVMFVHHSGKDTSRGARGHSSLLAATDTEIEVTHEDGEATRIARVTKQREMECSGEFAFSLHVVKLGINRRGKDVTSCVVVEDGGDVPKKRRGPRFSGHTKKAFEVLTNLLASDGKSGFPGAPPDMPSVPEDWWRDRFYEQAMPGATADAKKRAFRRAADALVEFHSAALANGRVWMPYGDATEDES